MKEGVLYIVATPIGNLEDITLRALRILKEVDFILCEDTRVTSRLLAKYEIKKTLISFHHHTKNDKSEKIIADIISGKNAALVTDAGTPGVSDPGNILVEKAIENEIKVIPVPGASALASIISVAGIDMQKFVFLGFPPHKKGRETFFKEVAASKHPVIYYESPHRVLKNLELLSELCHSRATERSACGKNGNPETWIPDQVRDDIRGKKIIVGRELTKMFEETIRGTIPEVLTYFQENPSKVKGEFVIVVY